jgi:hypothetical protein
VQDSEVKAPLDGVGHAVAGVKGTHRDCATIAP